MKLRIVAAFAAIYLVWGSTYLAIAYAVDTVPPLLMMGVRSVLAGAVLYGWARASGAPRPAAAHWRAAAVAGALLFLGGHGLLAWAEQRIPSGLAALLTATGALWMILLEWAGARRARPTAGALGGALLGLGGVALLLEPGGGGTDHLAGAGAVIAAALLWSAGSLYGRGAPQPASTAATTGMRLLAGGGWLVLASLGAGELSGLDLHAVTTRSAAAIAYLIVFGSIVGFSAYTWLMRATSAAAVSTHVFVNPAVAVLLGWLVRGETLTPRLVLAGAVVVAAVALIAGTARWPAGDRRPKPPRSSTNLPQALTDLPLAPSSRAPHFQTNVGAERETAAG